MARVGLTFKHEVQPSPDQIYRDLVQLDADMRDFSKPLRFTKQLLIEDQIATFEAKRDPILGDKWQEWSPAYAVRRGFPATYDEPATLIDKGKMFRASTSPRNWRITKDSVQFNTAALARATLNKKGKPYFVYHQQDRGLNYRTPRFQTIGKARVLKRIKNERHYQLDLSNQAKKYSDRYKVSNQVASKKILQREIDDQARSAVQEYRDKTGRRQHPQRRFMGASPYTIKLVRTAFDDWAEGVVQFHYRRAYKTKSGAHVSGRIVKRKINA